jgi:hypothetical protein
MTTDLTGDFGVDEEEFDWDVFLPDPDEAAIEAEAALLQDETELDLDDSDFDWEGALHDDVESEDGADNGARAGAAYDRIVDTVRRSFDEPEPQAGAAGPEAAPVRRDDEPAPDRGADSEATWADEPGWVPAVRFVDEPDPGLEVEVEGESDSEAAAIIGAISDARSEPEPWLDLEEEPILDEPHLDLEVAFEPEHEAEPLVPQFAEATETVGVLSAVEAQGPPSPGPDLTWAMAPSEPWEVDSALEPTSAAPVPRTRRSHSRADNEGEQKQKTRVFKATVVLACLVLVILAGVAALRARQHQTTTAGAPPAHVTSPAGSPSATGSGIVSATAASAGTARLQTATDAVDSATTAASVGITSLTAFPTPTNVETVINPYISSLQLYQTFLTGATVPAPARPAAAGAASQIRQDLQFLDTIDGLPPQQLGAFLAQFDTDATHLQTTLSTLEQNLRSSSS